MDCSVQTNTADWNSHELALYISAGFIERAKKKYDDRVDVVLEYSNEY